MELDPEAELGLSAVLANLAELQRPDGAELGELQARAFLQPLIPFGQTQECETPQQAAEAARSLGGETVVKAIAAGVLHKSDRGLVSDVCRDPAEVANNAELLLKRAAEAGLHEATLSVQTRLEGVELALGVRQTELGPVCLVAAGGTLIELLDDAAAEMAPLDADRAVSAIQSLRAARLLAGFRGDAAADIESVAELVVRLGALAVRAPEIRELDLNPVFVSQSGTLTADARCVIAAPQTPRYEPDPAIRRAAMHALFSPRRIAVVGASADQRKVGGLILRYLRAHGWRGELAAVNSTGTAIDDVRSVRSVSELDPAPDLACIAVPAAAARDVVAECVEAGVKAGVIYASGFAETGSSGQKEQDKLLEAAGDDFHFIGPNSIGIADFNNRLTASFGMGLETQRLPAGPVAFASQSGAIASALVSRAEELGIGFSHWISTGNEADIGVAECVDYFAEAPDSEVICLLLETIRRPAVFRAACARARAAGRPVVAMIAGRSEPGRETTASHTGAMTGPAAVYDAFFRDCGVIQVATLRELFVAAKALLMVGPAPGPRLGIISMSGGAASLLADQAVERGLEVPRLSSDVQRQLRDILPSFAAVRNPVDVTAVGIGKPQLVRAALNVVRRCGEVDMVAIQLSTNADPAADLMAADLIEARNETGAEFLIGRLGSPSIAPAAMTRYAAAGVPVFAWPDELAEAARACVVAGGIEARFRPKRAQNPPI